MLHPYLLFVNHSLSSDKTRELAHQLQEMQSYSDRCFFLHGLIKMFPWLTRVQSRDVSVVMI